MELGWRVLRSHYGRELIGVHIHDCQNLYSPQRVTTAEGCERYGKSFIVGLGTKSGDVHDYGRLA